MKIGTKQSKQSSTLPSTLKSSKEARSRHRRTNSGDHSISAEQLRSIREEIRHQQPIQRTASLQKEEPKILETYFDDSGGSKMEVNDAHPNNDQFETIADESKNQVLTDMSENAGPEELTEESPEITPGGDAERRVRFNPKTIAYFYAYMPSHSQAKLEPFVIAKHGPISVRYRTNPCVKTSTALVHLNWKSVEEKQGRNLDCARLRITVAGAAGGIMSRHVEYSILYKKSPLESPIHAMRRYKHFLWLYDFLKAKYPLRTVPNFPPRRFVIGSTQSVCLSQFFLGRFEPQFVEERRAGLENFLEAVLAHATFSADRVHPRMTALTLQAVTVFMTATEEKWFENSTPILTRMMQVENELPAETSPTPPQRLPSPPPQKTTELDSDEPSPQVRHFTHTDSLEVSRRTSWDKETSVDSPIGT